MGRSWSIAWFGATILLAGCAHEPNALDAVAERAERPLEMEFAASQDATAWLIDPKHTLRGAGLEQAQALVQELLAKGASDLRVSDLRSDVSDASFISAGRLLVRLPRSEKQRADVLEVAVRLGSTPPADPQEEIVVVEFPPGG